MNPLVSVIVPAHNHDAYIERTLDSIAAETYPSLEVVICDDGSTDATYDVARRWITTHPAIRARLLRQANQGVGRTLNRLLAEASGSFVASLASDDELVPGGIQRRLAAMTGGTRAVFGDAAVIGSDGSTIAPSSLRMHGSSIRRLEREPAAEIISRWRAPGPVLLVEAAALRELKGWSVDLVVEDWDLYLRLAARKWIRYVDATVGRYRSHETNVSMDPAQRVQILADHRRIAKRNAHLFEGRQRYALMLQRLIYQPRLVNTEYGRLRHIPARLVNKALRTVAERLAG